MSGPATRCSMSRAQTSQTPSQRTRKPETSKNYSGRLWTARRTYWLTEPRLKDLEAAEAAYNDAATDVQNSLQALKIFAVTPQELDNAERQNLPISPELAVRAPISGTVV